MRNCLALGLPVGLLLTGCQPVPPQNSTKSLLIDVYGEEFIEEQIPASETDGWTITFNRFLIVVGDVWVARGGSTLGGSSAHRVFDLAQPSGGGGFVFAMFDLEATDGLHEITYSVAPSADATAANASAADVEFMSDNGYSVYAEITAIDGVNTKELFLAFDTATTYAGCFTTIDFDVQNAGRVELTIHGDHFFYDRLGDDPAVQFGEIAAADADADGQVSADELLAVSIDPSRGADNLGDLIIALISTLGHIDGEGHCNDVTVE